MATLPKSQRQRTGSGAAQRSQLGNAQHFRHPSRVETGQRGQPPQMLSPTVAWSSHRTQVRSRVTPQTGEAAAASGGPAREQRQQGSLAGVPVSEPGVR